MKTKHIFPLVAILLIAACSKDDKPQGACDAFSYEGKFFETFQDAVDAVSSIASEKVVTITVNKDVTDNGAVLPEGKTLSIKLSLGTNIYTLNQGCSINTGSNIFEITGSGGEIRCGGDEFAIKCGEDGVLRLGGRISLYSKNLLNSSSPVVIFDDFTGNITGNVTLSGAPLHVAASTGLITIPVLSVNGEDAVFSADAVETDEIGTITIGKVVSDREYPVVCSRSDALSVQDGKVHVHDFDCCKIEGTCCIPDSYMLICKDCGCETADFNEHEVTYGNCKIAELIKHDRVEPSISQFGNMEYFECPDCGRIYRDNDGFESVNDGSIILLPTNIDDIMDSFVNDGPAGAMAKWGTDLILNLISLIPGVVTSEYLTWTTPVKQFREFSKRLTELSTRLDDISNQISKIAMEVKTIPYTMKVQDRLAQLKQIQNLNNKTTKALDVVFNNPMYSQFQMDSLKALHIQQWSGVYPGSTATLHPHEIVLTLMNDFSTVSIGPNVPQMYGEVLSSYYMWEHLGYTPRILMLLYDAVVVSTAYYYAQNYARVVKPYSSELMRYSYKTALEQSYKTYSEELKAELDRMKERDEKYRRFMPTNTTYERIIYNDFNHVAFFTRGKSIYLPRSDERVAINNCNDMMEYKDNKLVGTSFMDARVAKDTYQYYQSLKNQGKLPEGFPDNLNIYQLLDSLGFKGPFHVKNFRLLMNAPQSFDREGGDVQYPIYWNVKWRSYKGWFNCDWIDIAPVLKNDGTTCNDRLVDGCNIAVDDGLVTNLSKKITSLAKTATYGAIKVASQDQKPKEEK